MRLILCLLLVACLTLLFTPFQTARPLAAVCPSVVVICPEGVSEDGKTLAFRAEVKGVSAAEGLTYRWSISVGTISKGQDTSSITVEGADSVFDPITATVEVSGLPTGCSGQASCTTSVARMIGCPRPFDQHDNISFEDEKARLDNFAIQLQEELSARGFIIAYGGRTSYEGQASERTQRAKDYLTRKYNFMDDRIVTIDGGYRKDTTVELWIVPQEATGPAVSPTLGREDVQIIEKPVKSKPTQRRNR